MSYASRSNYHDLVIDVPVADGDLVVYHRWENLRHGSALGMVIGSDEGKFLVMWVDRTGRMRFDMHEASALRVLAQGKVRVGLERERSLRFFSSE